MAHSVPHSRACVLFRHSSTLSGYESLAYGIFAIMVGSQGQAASGSA
jgi:hypothetical protein